MIKDKQFYNRESGSYSSKRYPKSASNYIQFFFKKRLEYVLEYLGGFLKERTKINILEVGCADGIVLRNIFDKFGSEITEGVGIDIAEGMVEEAKKITNDQRIKFFIRGSEPFKKFDVILEVGVINYANFDEDLSYARERLKERGCYILSVAGSDSLNACFGKGEGYNNFLSYQKYEDKINRFFNIEKIYKCGIYMPLLWKDSYLGNLIQPILEKIFFFVPNFYHEKIYVLRAK